MAIFELNFNEINKDISGMSSAVSNYNESMGILKTNFKNVDSFWSDNNTDIFVENVKKDYIVYENYINSIKNYINYIEEFCDSIKSLIADKIGTHNASKFSINTDQLYNIILNLNDVYTYINNCVNELETAVIPYDFKYKFTLELYLPNFRSYRDQIGNLKSDLYAIYKGVLSKIDYYKTKINSVERYTISDSIVSYKWRISASDFVKNNNGNVKQKKYNVNSTENIDAETSELTVEKVDYSIGKSVNEAIKDEEYEHEEKLYTVQSNVVNEELSNETNESFEAKSYVTSVSVNDDLENKTYTLDEKIYDANNIEINNNLTETNIVSPEDKNYTVGQTNTNQSLNSSNISVEANEYTVGQTNTNQSLNSSNISVEANEYTEGQTNTNQSLNSSNISVEANEYTVGQTNTNQSLRNSSVSVGTSDYTLDNNVKENISKTNITVDNSVYYDA